MKKLILALAFLSFINQAQAQTVAAPTGVVAMVCANNTAVPTPTAGQFYYVQCDANGRLVTNGAGFSLVSKSGVASSVTGTVTETILAQIAIPPTLGANGQIRVRTYWTVTNSGNNKTLRVRLGTTGITSTQISSLIATTIASAMGMIDIQNANATNAQNIFTEIARGTDGLVTTVMSTSTADMTVAENIYITGQLANVGETITLIGYSVELAN